MLKITLKPKFRLKVLQFDVDLSQLAIKGKQSRGNLVTKNEIHRITLKEHGTSTLGGREVWFDPDVLRLNYDGRGFSLGEFLGNDQVLVILKNGDYVTTTFDAENHYDDNILRIEKFDKDKIWTAILYDADQKSTYIKRFAFESSAKRQSFIGGNPESRLILLSDNHYSRFSVKLGSGDAFRDDLIIDADEFIGIKSFRAKGKRLTNFTIDTITELEPRIVETEPEETPEEPEEITEVVPQEPEKSQKEIFDELTGQTSLFGTDEITE